MKSSVKIDEEIPVEPEMARSLRAKFENWANDVERENNKNNHNGHYDLPEDFTPQLEKTKSLKAKFESIKTDSSSPVERRKPRVNRFVVSSLHFSLDLLTVDMKLTLCEAIEPPPLVGLSSLTITHLAA